jgi:hypothetical protein
MGLHVNQNFVNSVDAEMPIPSQASWEQLEGVETTFSTPERTNNARARSISERDDEIVRACGNNNCKIHGIKNLWDNKLMDGPVGLIRNGHMAA